MICLRCGKLIPDPNTGYGIAPNALCSCCPHDQRPGVISEPAPIESRSLEKLIERLHLIADCIEQGTLPSLTAAGFCRSAASALAKQQGRIAAAPIDSRSRLRRIAQQKGEPMPDFSLAPEPKAKG